MKNIKLKPKSLIPDKLKITCPHCGKDMVMEIHTYENIKKCSCGHNVRVEIAIGIDDADIPGVMPDMYSLRSYLVNHPFSENSHDPSSA